MKTFFVVNPAAGKKRAFSIWERLRASIDFPHEFALTQGPGQATEIAREAVRAGYDKVVAIGGDGTIREVVQALAHTEACLGVIPAGTGNDFGRSLGIPPEPRGALEIIKGGYVRRVDLLRSGQNFFANVVGAGLDAEVVDAVNRGPKVMTGTITYVVQLLRVLAGYSTSEVTLEIDGRTVKRKAWLVAVSNARFFGGGMMICPDALVDDGLLDVCIVNEISKAELLRFLPTVFSGKHKSHPAFEVLKGKRVRMEFAPPAKVQADGDIIDFTPMEFSVEPGALRVLAGQV
ncbi:MAG: diacylglycerol kinase family lipid kinase [Bacillota bacterium]